MAPLRIRFQSVAKQPERSIFEVLCREQKPDSNTFIMNYDVIRPFPLTLYVDK